MKQKLSTIFRVFLFSTIIMLIGCSDEEPDQKTSYKITISPNINGEIKATLDNKEMNEAYEGQIITLTATANSGYEFIKWELNDGVQLSNETANSTTFIMPAHDVTIKAEFLSEENARYQIIINPNTGGEIKATFDNKEIKKAREGEVITLTATANTGYIFSKWEVDQDVTLSDVAASTTTFTMPAKDVTIDAEFLRIEPEANSYILEPNSLAVLIPVSRANRPLTADGLGAPTDGLGGVTADNYKVELVWSDRPLGEGNVIKEFRPYENDGEGYIYVEPGTAGNAVICIKVDDVIKWSWHIWVTDKVTFATDTETGVTWMDRNLGATANTPLVGGEFDHDQWLKTFGLFYQFGRKDPFPCSDYSNGKESKTFYTPDSPEGINTIPRMSVNDGLPPLVKNPLTRSMSSEFTGSLEGKTNNDSWGGETNKKTIYDPCPYGWKVPNILNENPDIWGIYKEGTNTNPSEWREADNKGRIFDGVNSAAGLGHYYPFQGINNASGPWMIGSRGYIMIANKPEYQHLPLFLSNTEATRRYYGSPRFLMPIRCVKE